MNASTVVLVVATAAFSGTSLALWQHLRAEREQNDALRAQITQFEKRTQAPPPLAELPVAEPTRASLPAPINQQSKPGVHLGALTVIRPDRNLVERQRRMLEDPEYRAALLTQARLSMRQAYPDIGTAMKLTPEQVDQFFDVLAERQSRSMHRELPDTSMDTREGQREWARRMEEQQRQNEAELANVLGPHKLQAWKDYQMSLGARMQVRELRSQLADSAEPLRTDQVESLVSVLVQEEKRFSEEMRGQFIQRTQALDERSLMKQGIEAQIRYNERRRDVVAPYLSAGQRERFDELIDQQIAMAKAQLKLAETQPQMSETAVMIDPTDSMPVSIGFAPYPP